MKTETVKDKTGDNKELHITGSRNRDFVWLEIISYDDLLEDGCISVSLTELKKAIDKVAI